MSRLRHSKGLPALAGAGSGVHRLKVDKPLPFKPEEERKRGGKIEGHKEHHRLGRKRGGSVKKKRDDGGWVTKTEPNDGGWKTHTESSGGISRPLDIPKISMAPKFPRGLQSKADGGKVAERGTDFVDDRGKKYGTKLQNGNYMADGGKVNWIQRAHIKKGALHEQLHVPKGEKIPENKLEKAAHSSNPTLRRRAALAKTLKGLHR